MLAIYVQTEDNFLFFFSLKMLDGSRLSKSLSQQVISKKKFCEISLYIAVYESTHGGLEGLHL